MKTNEELSGWDELILEITGTDSGIWTFSFMWICLYFLFYVKLNSCMYFF